MFVLNHLSFIHRPKPPRGVPLRNMEYRGKPTSSSLPADRLAQIVAHFGAGQQAEPPTAPTAAASGGWKPRRAYIDLGGGTTAKTHANTPCDVLPEPAAGKKAAGERSYLDAPRDALPQDPSLRSSRWFLADELNTMRHVSRTKQMGYDDKDFQGKPIIAIINTWSDLLPCHSHFKERVEEVKRCPWIARRDAPHERGTQEKQRLATVVTARNGRNG
jgi:hypothetical protein